MGVRSGVAAAAALAVLVVAAGASARTTAPRIVLKPDDVMVRGKVVVKGSGFDPNTTFTISECGETMWVVTTDPCADNSVTVTTDDRGKFRKKIVAALCPQDSPPTMTEETCYVGRRTFGVDTITLDPVAPLTVSWP